MSLPPPDPLSDGPMKPPAGKPPAGKPPAGKPGPLPMAGPQAGPPAVPGKPVAEVKPPVRGKAKGPSVLTILLCVFGGIALVMLLTCGGVSWFVYSRVQLAKQKVLEAQAQARAEAERASRIPPPHIVPPPHFGSPRDQPIDSVPRALAALDEHNHFRREQAVNYLATQPVDAAQRDAVMAKALALLGDWSRRDQGRRIVEKWVAASDAPKLLAAAQTAAQRNDRDTQRLLMQLLAKTGDAGAADAAVQYLLTGHDAAAAKKVLVGLGAAQGEKLLPLVNHPSPNVRQVARELLTEFGVDETLIAKQSVADLNSSDNERQREAARWLAQHVIVDEALSPQVNAALIQQLSVRQVRGDIAAALAVWATSDNIPALVEAADAANAAGDREAQRELVQLLAKLKDKRALPALADYMAARHDLIAARNAFATFGPESAETLLAFANAADGSLQHFARQLLNEWKIEPSAYIGQSLKDLASGDTNRQRSIANWLAQQPVDATQQPAVAQALEPLLDNRETRREAMRALKVWGTSESVPKLLTLLDDEDQFFRGEVLQALVATKDPRVVPHLASGFADDFFKRSEAARHLRAMGPIAESALWPHTASNDWQVAQEACHVLRDIGTRRSLPALQLATQHANPIVKNAAASAIKEVEAAKRTVDPMPAANSETPVVASRGLREWKDASGKNKIQAEFVEFASGKVKLKTRDGRTLALTLAQLSPEDRRHVIELMQQQP